MKTIQMKKIFCALILLAAIMSSCFAYAEDNAATDTRQTFSQEELAQMLAPIALYPDPLLSQILMAATYPFDVAEAERWITKNPFLKGAELDEALKAKDWDVSILALCHYPKVLTMMSENLSWTASVGDAFANQEEDVTDTIQELRTRAREAGNLSTTREQKVIVEDRYVRIEPVSPDYIYVPAYDPLVVYGTWWLPMYPPFTIVFPGLVVSGPGLVFSPPFYVGFGVFGWSSFNWGLGRIVIYDIDRTRRYYRHHDRYRWPDRHHWRPDGDRRHIRERRAGEIPRFVPPVRSKPDMRRWDSKPVPDVRTPDRRDFSPDRRRDIRRDDKPRWNQPDVEKRRRPDAGAPRVTDRPTVSDRPVREQDRPVREQDRPVIQDRRPLEKDKPAEKPRIQDRDKGKVPEQGVAGPPVIRDRSRDENRDVRRQAPAADRQTVTEPQRGRERDSGQTIRTEPRGDKEDRQERSRERWGERRDR